MPRIAVHAIAVAVTVCWALPPARAQAPPAPSPTPSTTTAPTSAPAPTHQHPPDPTHQSASSEPGGSSWPGSPGSPTDVVEPEEIVEWEPEPALIDYVTASTKLTEQARQSPSSVWVVTREQIELAGYRSVAEALVQVPGLLVSYDLDNYNVALRGLYGGARAGSRYIKVMIDGRAISFAQSGVHYLGPEFIPIIAVERIEVVRGPVSSLYGAGALVGAINIVTRRPPYEGSLTTLTVLDSGGSLLGARGGMAQGVQIIVDKRSFLLLAAGAGVVGRGGLEVPLDSAFRDRYVENGMPLRSSNDTARPMSALIRGEQYVGGGRLSGIGALQLHAASNQFHDLVGSAANKATPYYTLGYGNRSELYAGGLGLSFERSTRSRVTVLASAGFWTGGTRDGEIYNLDPKDTSASAFNLTRQLSYQLVEGGVELRYNTEGDGWLQLGVDGQYDREHMPRVIEIGRDTGVARVRTGTGTSETLANLGAYAQALLPVHDKVRVAGTVRWDQHNIYGGALSARAAVVVTPTPQLALKLMGGRSYKAPSPEQLFGIGIDTLDVTGSKTIAPQYLNGVEMLIDYYLARQVNVNLGAYYQRYVDTLSYIRLGTGLMAQPFDAESYGLEATLRTSVPAGRIRIEGSTGVAVQQMLTESNVVDGVREKSVPDNEGVPVAQVNGRLALFGPRGSGGQVLVRYVGERTPSQSNLLLASGRIDMTVPFYMLHSYLTVDASLASPALALHGDRVTLKVRAGVTNLFDKRYAEIGFNGIDIPSLGRIIWFNATAAF